ncbi:MAG: efflux RND transporter permease subunit [Aestuariivita sp.]|nr:efflux RND transporter permease subunit [Aestuariivita sp.]MCY4347948.1 efflux RND transporter permease subunit [Aestuariivita sp.]
MFNLAKKSIEYPIVIWLVILLCLGGGISGFFSLGRLEDPAFTIKSAVITAEYPGASAAEVAREVADPIESEIQKIAEIDLIESVSRPGETQITVTTEDQYGGDQLLKIWAELRNRVADANLPIGAGKPSINDSFGDVFGLYYAVTADGFPDRDIYQLATFLRKELLTVDGVADVQLQGVPQEVIYVEPYASLAFNLNVPPAAIQSALNSANSLSDGGSLHSGSNQTLILGPDGSDTLEEISGLTIGVAGELVTLEDFADVYRARTDIPSMIVRHNGIEAFTVGIASVSTDNVVDVGARIERKLSELQSQIPVGIEIYPVYQQHRVVAQSVNDFWINLGLSVSIVIVVLALFMGWRAALVVGSTLLLTVIGTLFFMAIFAIEMERISLGALIIAMGMLVDNAIVVAEGMQTAMRQGHSSRAAATDIGRKLQTPLFGATAIGIMAFAGVGLSTDSTGEFLFSLFAVIAISLTLSWVLAVTVTPLLGHYVFARSENIANTKPRLFHQLYGAALRKCFDLWWLVIAIFVAITIACIGLFGEIKQQFFPESNTPLFFVDYKLTQGTSLRETSSDLAQIESWLNRQPSVIATTAFVGQGSTRFMLTYQAEDPNPSYGHIIVRTENLDEIDPLIAELLNHANSHFPHAQLRAKRLAFGPGGGEPIQIRLSGSNPKTLRDLADQAVQQLLAASTNIIDPRLDWRQMEQVLRPVYAVDRAQEAGITRDDVTRSLLYANDGVSVGVYREQERQIPIIVRANRSENISLTDQPVYSEAARELIPFEQVTDGLRFEGKNTLMVRRDRVFTITVGADVASDKTVAEVQNEIHDAITSMPLPSGYRMAWGGEYENSRNAQASLADQLPTTLLVMLVISILLFNALRQPFIVWLLIPMAINGVTLALLGSGLPFTFTALLGLLSLSGMLIKNGIVLVEEIDQTRERHPQWPLAEAIVTAALSRARPVFLAAATTILGMLPLITDVFFRSMAVTIMGGLAFASLLTLIAAPVLYFAMFPNHRKAPAKPADSTNTSFVNEAGSVGRT